MFGYPFLTSWFQYADLPVLGRVPLASAVLFDLGVVVLVVGATVLTLVALAHQSLRKPKQRDAEEGEPVMMELVLALAIGVLAGSGVWLLLRPRTFQVIMGLSLLSYAVNIFIFAMGRLKSGAPPVLAGEVSDPARYTDPTPQALVLTAIVISFALTALFLVVILAARGITGSDHVDGKEPDA